ncbi:WXG100 family type VII secretion target [Streptomyces roseoviridis]|uniref:WXG100 family type VII secretion target n=1 Tax=Streptomyces roseoviridis TaxID=67361 RepID=A0ABV5QP88_9ACTN
MGIGGLGALGDLVDKGVDLVDKGIDKGKEVVGEGVDYVTDKAGEGLRHYGYDGVAEAVEDWGDETASSLGAEVGEKQLGQTEEADELIHGKPERITSAVKNLRDFKQAFDLVGSGMKQLDASHWHGAAADAFRKRFETLPLDWLRAADAFGDAAQALETYGKTVTSAQGKAREAIALYKEAKEDYERAADAYEKKAKAYNDARTSDHPLPHPGEFSDPSTEKRRRAQEVLDDARKARNEAAEAAKTAVRAAMAHAPKEPTGRDKLKYELMDHGLAQGIELAHFGGGIIKGTAGLVNFVRSVNPLDPYNVTHPAEYYKGVNMTLAGLASTVANPDRALKNAWEAAKGDPSEFFGRLVPELIGTKGTGLVRGGLRAGLKGGVDVPGSGRRGLGDGLDGLTSRGSGGEIPSHADVKRAVIDSKPEPIKDRKWSDDDGRYYASQVLKGGRADGETVFAGHGYMERYAGETVVPEGTTISFYIPHAERLPGLNGVAVEGGSYPGGAVETFGPGDRIPDYTLAPPEPKGGGGFTVYENSTTVAKRTNLSELLKENMGNVHWAACRELE